MRRNGFRCIFAIRIFCFLNLTSIAIESGVDRVKTDTGLIIASMNDISFESKKAAQIHSFDCVHAVDSLGWHIFVKKKKRISQYSFANATDKLEMHITKRCGNGRRNDFYSFPYLQFIYVHIYI